MNSTSKTYTFGNYKFTRLAHPTYTDIGDLHNLYWSNHPRFLYFKNVVPSAKLLDLGAGPGSVALWKNWKEPLRPDINMYAADIQAGEFLNLYQDYHLCDLEKDKIKFSSKYFDSILCSHVFEHISNLDHLLSECRRLLKPAGQFYIECPSQFSLKNPSNRLFAKKGISVSTVNFFDDPSHLRTFSLAELTSLLEHHQFQILRSGYIDHPYLEDEMFTYGIDHDNIEIMTYAVWARTRFSQYVVCQKI
jgi:SAM-dependent methyltransferase